MGAFSLSTHFQDFKSYKKVEWAENYNKKKQHMILIIFFNSNNDWNWWTESSTMTDSFYCRFQLSPLFDIPKKDMKSWECVDNENVQTIENRLRISGDMKWWRWKVKFVTNTLDLVQATPTLNYVYICQIYHNYPKYKNSVSLNWKSPLYDQRDRNGGPSPVFFWYGVL